MQTNGWRRLAITSPGPASGKSTISLNLGYSLTLQPSTHVILCEMDLRKPSLRRILGASPEYDFAKVVNGTAAFADQALRLRPNFAVAAARSSVDHSAELLQDAALAETLNRIEAEYDPTLMIFDMPPLQVCDDTMAFVDKVDCVLIVAGAESTKINDLDQCERELAARTNILGIVLNKCRYGGSEQSYDYYG